MKKSKYLRLIAPLVVVSLILSAFAACQTKNNEKDVKDDPAKNVNRTIGVSLLTREHVFYNNIEKAVKAEADRLGYKLIIQDANRDSNTQMSQVQNFITQKVDAIILCPTSSAGIKSAIDLAEDAKIPVFTMDIAAEGKVASHVGTDNKAGGRLAGDYTANKILNKKGKAAIVTYSEVESCVDREEGFKEEIAKYPDIKIVDVQNCSGSAEKAANVTMDMLLKNPDLDVIFGVGDPFAMGALSAIKAANKKVKIIGFDGNPEGIAEIKKKDLWIADVAQNPQEIGKSTINLIKDHLEGKQVPKLKLIEPYIIDASNAE